VTWICPHQACQGFSALQAERIRAVRTSGITADKVALEIEGIMNPPPPKRGGGAPGLYTKVDGVDGEEKRLVFRKLATGVCSVSMGTSSLYQAFSEEDEEIKRLTGLRKSEISYFKAKLLEFSVAGEFNAHAFRKVMYHYGVTDMVFIERFFEIYETWNGREHVVKLPWIVQVVMNPQPF